MNIDKDIPVPPARHNYGKWRDLLSQMDVGDSVFLTGLPVNQVSSVLGAPARKLGIKITARTIDGGIRVWRTA